MRMMSCCTISSVLRQTLFPFKLMWILYASGLMKTVYNSMLQNASSYMVISRKRQPIVPSSPIAIKDTPLLLLRCFHISTSVCGLLPHLIGQYKSRRPVRRQDVKLAFSIGGSISMLATQLFSGYT